MKEEEENICFQFCVSSQLMNIQIFSKWITTDKRNHTSSYRPPDRQWFTVICSKNFCKNICYIQNWSRTRCTLMSEIFKIGKENLDPDLMSNKSLNDWIGWYKSRGSYQSTIEKFVHCKSLFSLIFSAIDRFVVFFIYDQLTRIWELKQKCLDIHSLTLTYPYTIRVSFKI